MADNTLKIVGLLVTVIAIGGLAYTWQQGMLQGWLGIGEEETSEETQTETSEETSQVIKQERIIIREVSSGATSAVTEAFPVEQLNAAVKDKYTQASVSDTEIRFYEVGADVSDPNVKALDTITISSGTGSTTGLVVQTKTDYDVYFNGTGTYYDEKIKDWVINYNPDTGKGYLLVNGKSYYPAVNFGTFVDVDSLAEGTNTTSDHCFQDVGTDSIKYDESAGSGSCWFKIDIGNNDANSEIHEPVMCFKDGDGDMEGDELTGLTASYVSGSTQISIPGSLLGYWKEGMGSSAKRCLDITAEGVHLGPSEKARWELTFTFDESNFDAGEEFEISFDDNGDISQRQYPSSNVKVSSETLTIGDQA